MKIDDDEKEADNEDEEQHPRRKTKQVEEGSLWKKLRQTLILKRSKKALTFF